VPTRNAEPCWLSRMNEIPTPVDEIRMPSVQGLPQDREWCEAVMNGRRRRLRFHDYGELYRVPGLYEKLFYECLECCSPSRVASLLEDVMTDFEANPEELRVLDVGAGNGMVGDELAARGAERIVGVDIIQEARDAADRDRPDVYGDYLVTDLTDLPEAQEERLRRENFNCLTTVAALGFGDIPPKAFAKALDLTTTPGWLAFNIKEDFLNERDSTGFCRLIRQLCRDEVIQIQAYQRYRHRLSVTGEPLYYVAVVARKLKDLPDDIEELWEAGG
jgi:SAM-dependent methyltransferase